MFTCFLVKNAPPTSCHDISLRESDMWYSTEKNRPEKIVRTNIGWLVGRGWTDGAG